MASLLIDKGNSRIKWQLCEANQVLTKGSGTNEQELNEVFKNIQGNLINSVFVANVAGDSFDKELVQWAKKAQWPKPNFIQTEKQAFGVTNGYLVHEQLGVDRWLAIIAAYHAYPGLVCVVDCGTAFTIDFIHPNGEHLGGFILPGVSLMKNSLLENTSKINAADESKNVVLGLSTSQAVALAPAQALAAFIQKKIQEIESDVEEIAVLVITGGEAEILEDVLDASYHVELDLVFKGLQLYAQ